MTDPERPRPDRPRPDRRADRPRPDRPARQPRSPRDREGDQASSGPNAPHDHGSTTGGAPATEAAGRLASRYGEAARVESSFGQDTVDVPRESWLDALTAARDEFGFGYFDWLTGVDQLDAADDPGFDVVAHLWSLPRREHLLLRTRVPAETPTLASATGIFSGANWHERETFEMFGVTFDGHPNLVPLLLPDGFEGNPLRKDFVLAARAAKPWPGAKEPGESDADLHGAPSRRKTRPPGVPDPAEWGPRRPGRTTEAEEPAAGDESNEEPAE